MDKGVLLRFDAALDPTKAADPDNYSRDELALQAHLSIRLAAVQGGRHARHRPAGAEPRVSLEGRPQRLHRRAGMKPVMQMRVGWSLATASGAAFENSAYFTPYELPAFDPAAEGFGDITVDLSPRADRAGIGAAPVSADEGPSRRAALRLHRVPRDRRDDGHDAGPDTGRASLAANARYARGSRRSVPTRPTCGNRSSSPRRRSCPATSAVNRACRVTPAC